MFCCSQRIICNALPSLPIGTYYRDLVGSEDEVGGVPLARMKRVPLRLGKEPIIEAVWELRFLGGQQSIADILPGLIYGELPKDYSRIVRLPAADIPQPILVHDPSLRYTPRIRIEANNRAVLVGERVVSLSVRRPYPGWKMFSDEIATLLDIVEGTGLVKTLERTSLKYIDVIDVGPKPNLAWLDMTVRLGEHELDGEPVQVRAELNDGGLVHIIQAVSPVEVTVAPEEDRARGVLLEIDSIKPIGSTEGWSDVKAGLDAIHSASKKMFFSLLTEKTVAALDPVYEE